MHTTKNHTTTKKSHNNDKKVMQNVCKTKLLTEEQLRKILEED